MGASNEAQQLILQGADIKEPVKDRSMIDCVIAEALRHREITPWRAQNCDQLIQILQRRASELLAMSVLSDDGGNLAEIAQLSGLKASCYQSEKFGPLGLLGELLKQDKTPIRLEIVKLFIEKDTDAKFGLTRVDSKQQTCLSIAKNNPKCPKDVKQYIQNSLDMIVNKIPFTHPHINPDSVVEWIHQGANPEAVDEHRNTVLLNAVITNNQNLVDKLVGAGCNTLHVNNENLTALQIVQNTTPRNAQLETILKAQNINVGLKQLIETKKSLLTFDEVNALLEEGAKINTPIANKSTLLHLLIANEGTPEMIAAFVNDFNADIMAMDIQGYRPIETCILLDKNPFNVLQTYLKLPKMTTQMYYNTKLNKSILQFAKDKNRAEVTKIIQDALNLRLWNLIAQASTKEEHNRTLITELNQMITYGAQIDHIHTDKEYKKWTILHLACKTTTKTFVQFLIEYVKTNCTVTNGNGDYPLSIAAKYGHLSIVQYLRGLPNVKLNVSNKDKQTPLHLATKNHHLLVVKYLVLWGADYQSENISKQTPLDIARTNISKNRQDELTDKTLIHFLEQLICPMKDQTDQQQSQSKKANYNLDTCELVKPVIVGPIQITDVGEEERLGQKSRGLLQGNANDNLLEAAKEGFLDATKAAIGAGANICYRSKQGNAYKIAQRSIIEYHNKAIESRSKPLSVQHFNGKMIGCQQIVEVIRHTAYKRLTQGIDNSLAYRVLAYHQAGAPLPGDLLSYSCSKTDNVEIIHYLVDQSPDIFQATFEYSTDASPYRIAKRNRFENVASYLKYRLSVECTKAIRENNIEYVKKLIRAGASVDMYDTNNIEIALEHKNAELVQILCENGAKLPMEWLQSEKIILSEKISQTMDSEIVFRINNSLINRRLRLSAANGDFNTLIHCQYLGSDINSENCYGSTALLCSIQHGNYFSIVHSLVSRGATILHSNENENMSLIALTKKHNYTQIMNYLSQELNRQFLITILNNDIKSAEKFEKLGADFNYHDEQKRTALHYAVQYHGVELVSWLCIRGSTPTLADINGNYPITEATEKGDYAVVELLATKYPTTKQQKNKAGLTALQIAQKQGFKRIAYVLETGKPAPDSLEDDETKSDGPKHTREELIQAAKNGRLKIIKEFIADPYESIIDKRQLCFQLIDAAEKAKQHEVVNILKLYSKEIKPDLALNITQGSSVTLNHHYTNILIGFLTSLGKVIAESSIVLDPADPNTYKDLVSNMTANQRKHSQEIYKVGSERDAQKLSDQDVVKINEKLTNIKDELTKLNEEKIILEKNMQETTEQLKSQEQITAIQRQDLFKQQEEHKKQLAVYESSIFLYELQKEATLNRKHTVDYFRDNTNMYLFFRTIENLLQALFHAALAARSGLITMEPTSGFGTAAGVIDNIPTSIIPLSEPIIEAVKLTVGTVLSKLDEREQKKECYNISTLGNIEELGRIASDTASLLTLYYQEQIKNIDTSERIKGSNIFNQSYHWIKDKVIDVRPEKNDEMPVIIVAEYITGWIIDALKEGKNKLKSEEPLPQQLWFCVAKKDCVNQGKKTAVTDVLGETAGRIMIPLRIRKADDKKSPVYVQLRHLIGYVSLVAPNCKIYQYKVTKDASRETQDDLKVYGYVYLTPFLNGDKESFDLIIKGRDLVEPSQDEYNNIVTKFKDVEQYAINFEIKGNHDRKSAITTETAHQIAQVLRNERTFLDRKGAETILDEARQKIEISVNVLREDIQQKTHYYQTSIDATSEKLGKDVAEAREALRKDNEKHHNDVLKKIDEKLKQVEINLGNQIAERMNTIEKQLRSECYEMRKIVEAAKENSNQALIKANEAVQASKESAQHSKQAYENAKKLVESTEQRKQEFQVVMDRCEANVKQTITEQKLFCEQSITAVRTKVQQDFERAKELAQQSAVSAKESSQAAKESVKLANETQKDTRRQLDLQKEETKKIIVQVKEITRQNEQSANEAKDASKQTKQGAEASVAALKKINEMERKMENALERLEKLTKK